MPDVHIVARLDGRGFTRLTKEDMKFEAPFDVHFREYMVETVRHLMNCGFNIVYGYTQSDEYPCYSTGMTILSEEIQER